MLNSNVFQGIMPKYNKKNKEKYLKKNILSSCERS